MTNLEAQVRELRAQLEQLTERVRLDAVAGAFLKNVHEIREGDYFLYNGTLPTRLNSISSEGKWTFFDGHHVIEPFRVPRPGEHDRLYTIAEVAEIVSRAIATKNEDAGSGIA